MKSISINQYTHKFLSLDTKDFSRFETKLTIPMRNEITFAILAHKIDNIWATDIWKAFYASWLLKLKSHHASIKLYSKIQIESAYSFGCCKATPIFRLLLCIR